MVEGLLLLRLRWIEGEARGTFDVGNGHCLLRARLVHGNRRGTAFTIGGMGELHRGQRTCWKPHAWAGGRHGDRRPRGRRQSNNRLACIWGHHSEAGVDGACRRGKTILGDRHS